MIKILVIETEELVRNNSNKIHSNLRTSMPFQQNGLIGVQLAQELIYLI